MKVDTDEAIYYAEIIANKDSHDNEYHFLKVDTQKFEWKTSKNPHNRAIYQKILHDADCLDIIRARDHFDGQYLNFYQDWAKDHREALFEIGHLIIEARSLIEIHGDGRKTLSLQTKKTFEGTDVYQKTWQAILNQPQFRLIRFYHPPEIMTQTDKISFPLIEKSIKSFNACEPSSMQSAMLRGKLFARAIHQPTLIVKKSGETQAQLEIRKILRRPDHPTASKKIKLGKNGNPNRSTSIIGWASGLIASQGFLILNPCIEQMKFVSDKDCNSGFYKRKIFKNNTLPVNEASLKSLRRLMKVGGKSQNHGKGVISTHNEIIMDVTQVDAIFFTSNNCMYNYGKTTPHSSYLQAYYIQQAYRLVTGRHLPLYEYSMPNNTLLPILEKSEEELIHLWSEMIEHCVLDFFSKFQIGSNDIEKLKTYSVYGLESKQIDPIDRHYPVQLKDQLNTTLLTMLAKRKEMYNNSIIDEIKLGQTILDWSRFHVFLSDSHLLEKHADFILPQIEKALSSFKFKDHTNRFSVQWSWLKDIADNERSFFRCELQIIYFISIVLKKFSWVAQIESEIELLIVKLLKSVPQINHFGGDSMVKTLISLAFRFNLFAKYQDDIERFAINRLNYYKTSYDMYAYHLTILNINDAGLLTGELRIHGGASLLFFKMNLQKIKECEWEQIIYITKILDNPPKQAFNQLCHAIYNPFLVKTKPTIALNSLSLFKQNQIVLNNKEKKKTSTCKPL